MEPITVRDRAVIGGQLGRAPRAVTGVPARCPYGYPAVIETAPVLWGGEPNPTLLFLTCPALVKAMSRVESTGGVRRFKEAYGADPDLRDTLLEVTSLYQERRAALAGRESGAVSLGTIRGTGIGGPESPEVASCLHAYAAALLATESGWLSDRRPAAAGAPAEGAGARRRSGEALSEAARAAWRRFLPPLEESWCRDRLCGRWDNGRKLAAIDVGTISVRLLVADMEDQRPRTLVRLAEITRLGEGLRPGGPLGEAAKRRTAEVVARFVGEARRQEAESIVLAATSAARDAADGEDFVRSLGAENGITAAILPGLKEAQLAYAGASLDVAGHPVVIDIGGGSTEFIRRLGDGAVEAISLDIGAGRLTERRLTSDPPTGREMADARREAEQVFSGMAARYQCRPPAQPAGPDGTAAGARRLVGVAGTVTTLAGLDLGLQVYDPERIHLASLSLESVRGLVARLGAMTTAERAALPCVQAGRAPVIVGGAVILQAAMETLGYDGLTVSERDLLDGLVMYGVE